MALIRARQLDLARARFASLMVESPNLGPTHRGSYRDSLLLPPFARTPPQPQIRTHESRSVKIRKKIAEIRRNSSLANPMCMRCGSKGHLAVACRNSPLCFICNKHGHKGPQCSDSPFSALPAPPAPPQNSKSEIGSAMAPPGYRRGSSRARPYHPGGRPPDRSFPNPAASSDGQTPPEQPFLAQPRPSYHISHQPPHIGRSQFPASVRPPPHQIIQQTPPDRPVQARSARTEVPRVPIPAPVTDPTPPRQRNIRPPILMFNPTPESEAIDRELQLSFLLDDIAAWGPEKVERILRSCYPPFLWVVQVFDEFVYLIQAPSDDWVTSATRKKWLRMEDVQFPILRWDPSFNAGRRLQSVWVRLTGFPMNLWNWGEFNSVFAPFGAIVLDLDPGTRFRYDYRFARIRIGISDISVLPTDHSLTRRNTNGFVATYDLEFEVETEQTDSVLAWRGRLNGRPYPNGTPFGVRPNAPNPAPFVPPPIPPAEGINNAMDIDPLAPPVNPVTNHQPLSSSHSAPPKANFTPNLSLVPPLYPSHRHVLHGPSPQPPRNRGISLNEPSPISKPILGHSPKKGKGKNPLPSCTQENDNLLDGHETSDSDEDSFQHALEAIYKLEKGFGSTSGGTSTAPDPPPTNPDQEEPKDATLDSELVVNSNATLDSENELMADLSDTILDVEPISVRAQRLQIRKDKNSHFNPKTPPPRSKKKLPQPHKVVSFSPAAELKTKPSRRPSISPARRSNTHLPSKHHRPRSRTRKPVLSASTSQGKVVFAISDNPIAGVGTPEVNLEEYYRPYTSTIPRRSVRLQVNHTQTPIMKRAQKRKASSSAKYKGNPLLLSYPYNRLTLEQVNDLFRVYQIKLGNTPHEQAVIIAAIKQLGRNQFEQVLKNLAYSPKEADGSTSLSLSMLDEHNIVVTDLNRDSIVSL